MPKIKLMKFAWHLIFWLNNTNVMPKVLIINSNDYSYPNSL